MFPGDEEPQEKKECFYTVGGHEFRHSGTMRVNRMQMVENLRFAFPEVNFVHRCDHSQTPWSCVCVCGWERGG